MTQRPGEIDTTRKWDGRPVLAFVVKSSVYVVPIVASVLASIWLSKRLPTPETVWQLLGWWAAIIGVSTTVLFVVDKAARRFLPLAALLQMTMIFPDRSPSRFRTALRSGASLKNLKRQLDEAAAAGRANDATRAAEIVLQLSSALNAHDPRTRGHSERVRAYTEMLAEEMGVSEEDRAKLRWASLLHDIGKLKVATEILNKPGKLDDDEWAEIKQHPLYGAELCGPLIDWLGPWAGAIIDHHERWDGFGYPAGKQGPEISLGGRITCVADAYDVMTTARSYKKPMPAGAAREELARHAGAQFDPEVVRAFLELSMGRLRWIAGPLSWLAQLPFLNFAGVIQNVGTTLGVATVATVGATSAIVGGVVDLPGDDPLALPPPPEALAEYVALPAVLAQPDAFETVEDTALGLAILANDLTTDGFTVRIVDEPGFGRVILEADGTVRYVPDPDFHGTDRFSYAVVAPEGDESVADVTVTVASDNDLPVASDDRATTDEDTSVLIDVLANDADTEGLDPASVRVGVPPLNGEASVEGGGAIRYTPAQDFSGVDGFTYTVVDTDGATATATVTVAVAAINDPPVANPDDATVAEDSTVVVAVLANDEDVDGDLLAGSLAVVRAPGLGTASVSGDSVRYTPDPDAFGRDSFDYHVCDTAGACATATVRIVINGVNDAPTVPGPVGLTVEDGASVSFDPLAGAEDPDGDPVTVGGFDATTALGGSVAPGLVYTAPVNADGVDTFTYEVSDGIVTVTVAVSVTVVDVNHPPAIGPVSATVDEDTATPIDLLSGVSDADGDPLTVAGIDAGGAVGLVVDHGDGTVTYVPPPDFNGSDSFGFTVTDGVSPVTGTITVLVTPVPDEPEAADDAVSLVEDGGPAVVDLASNDTDVDGDLDPASVAVTAAPALGTVVPNGDGTVTYSPSADAAGSDVFSYEICDATGLCDEALVFVTITAVDDPPVAFPDAYSATEDVPLVVAAPGVLGNDVDVDSPLTAALQTAASSGTAVVNPDGSFSFTPDPDFAGTVTFSYRADDGSAVSPPAVVTIEVAPVQDVPVAVDDAISVAEDDVGGVTFDVLANDTDADGETLALSSFDDSGIVDGALTDLGDGSFHYVPDPSFVGVESLSYTVTDGAGGFATATATITVFNVPDVPVASGDSYTTTADTPLVVAAPGLLGNDSDEDGDPLSVVVAPVTAPSNGAVSLNADGSFTYTPDPGFIGTDVFTYRIDDGTGSTADATATIVVDDGIASGFLYLTSSGSGTEYQLSGTPEAATSPVPDYEGDGDPGFTVHASGGKPTEADPDKFQLFVYQPAAPLELNGPVTLELWSTVGQFDPTDDADLDAVLYDCAADGTDCTVLLEYHQHVDEWNGGIADWVFRPFDLGSVDTTIATTRRIQLKLMFGHHRVWVAMSGEAPGQHSRLVVTEANRRPLAGDDAASLDEDTGPVVIDVTANDTDLNLDPSTVSINSSPSNGSITGVNALTGDIGYDPDPDWSGVDAFDYEICDTSGLCDTATVTVTVNAINDAPVVTPGQAFSVAESAGIGTTAGAVTASDVDSTLTGFAIVGGNADAVFGIDTTGIVSIVDDTNLNYEATSQYLLQVTATDGTATSPPETVTIDITDVNEAPVVASDPDGGDTPADFEAIAGFAHFIPAAVLLDNDLDPDGDPLAIVPRAPTATPNGTYQCDGSGCTYTPNAGFVGTEALTYNVTDGRGGTATATLTVDSGVRYLAAAASGMVRFNEIHARATSDEEFIEIVNTGAGSVDLTGWRLADGNLIAADCDTPACVDAFDYTFPATVLGSGEHLVVWVGSPSPPATDSPADVVRFAADPDGAELANAGDDLWLLDGNGHLVDYLYWGAFGAVEHNAPPPASWWNGASAASMIGPSGTSMAFAGGDPDDASCWEPTQSGSASCIGALATFDSDAYSARRSSVGASNNLPLMSPMAGSIVVNEVFAAGDESFEFVEIKNAGIAVVDLAGWTVTDGLPGYSGPLAHTFGPTVLNPGDYLVLWLGPNSAPRFAPGAAVQEWAGATGSTLEPAGDSILLTDAAGDVVDYVAWGTPPGPVAPASLWATDAVEAARLAAEIGAGSIALSGDGIDSDNAKCFEGSGSGTNTCGSATAARTPAYPVYDASPGWSNTDWADLDVDMVASSPVLPVDFDFIASNLGTATAYGVITRVDIFDLGLAFDLAAGGVTIPPECTLDVFALYMECTSGDIPAGGSITHTVGNVNPSPGTYDVQVGAAGDGVGPDFSDDVKLWTITIA